MAAIAETAKTSTRAVSISRYGGGRRLGLLGRRLASSVVEYTVAVRNSHASDVLECMQGTQDSKLTQTLKRHITELNLEDEFRMNGGGNPSSLTVKQRSIARAPSADNTGFGPGSFGGSTPADESTESDAADAEETDYTFYYSGAGVLGLCLCAMYCTRSKGEKTTPVLDISEMEEAKPEVNPDAKPPKPRKSKRADTYELGDAPDEFREGPPAGKTRTSRSSSVEPGAGRGRRPLADDVSDIAAASTTASSESGRRGTSDVSSTAGSTVPSQRPGRRLDDAPAGRRAKTEGLREPAGTVPRRYTELDTRRAMDGRPPRRSVGQTGGAGGPGGAGGAVLVPGRRSERGPARPR